MWDTQTSLMKPQVYYVFLFPGTKTYVAPRDNAESPKCEYRVSKCGSERCKMYRTVLHPPLFQTQFFQVKSVLDSIPSPRSSLLRYKEVTKKQKNKITGKIELGCLQAKNENALLTISGRHEKYLQPAIYKVKAQKSTATSATQFYFHETRKPFKQSFDRSITLIYHWSGLHTRNEIWN